MITRIQNYLLRHHKWFFSALLVVIIVAFVLTIGNQSIGGNQTMEVERREYYGYDIDDPEVQRLLVQHASLSLQMDPMLQFSPGFRQSVGGIGDYAYLRLAALGLANTLGVPVPGEEALRDFMRSRSAFTDPQSGEFDQSRYTEFTDFLEANPDFDRPMLARVLREDYRIQAVLDALGGPGYLLPFEARQTYLARNTSWTVQVATADYASFSPEIEISPEDLEAYYEENPGTYTLPERIRTTAVFFNAEAFLDQVPAPTEEELESYFARNRQRYQPAPDPSAEEPAPEVTLAEVRDEVAADLRRERARERARIASDEFTAQLYEDDIERGSEAFDAAVAAHRGVLRPLPPFSRENPPPESGVPDNLLQSIWIYAGSNQRYFSDLATTDDGAALLVFEELLPETLQPLAEVRDTVMQDLRSEEKRRLFTAQAREWRETLTAALEEGTPFPAAAEAAGLSVTTPEPFEPTNLPEALDAQAWDEVATLQEGALSDPIIDEEAARFVHVEEKSTPPDVSGSATQTAFAEQLREQRETAAGWLALRDWTRATLASLSTDE
ncbi:MAG: hypothetical protein ACLFU2_00350 [Opitutales bacterium]